MVNKVGHLSDRYDSGSSIVKDPDGFSYDGVRFVIMPNVLSPAEYPSSIWFVKALIKAEPNLEGKRMMEIGCGSGFVAQYLALRHGISSVIVGDIDPIAVSCARQNREQLGLDNRVTIVESDIYAGFSGGERADIIYWNHPWLNSEIPLNPQFYDANYKGLERFIAGAEAHLQPNGRVFLGFGDRGDVKAMKTIAHRYAYQATVVETCDVTHGSEDEKIMLFEIKRPTAPHAFAAWGWGATGCRSTA